MYKHGYFFEVTDLLPNSALSFSLKQLKSLVDDSIFETPAYLFLWYVVSLILLSYDFIFPFAWLFICCLFIFA